MNVPDPIDITQKSRIDLFKAGMVAHIKQIMPGLRDVTAIGGRFNLDELSLRSIRAPAAFPTILKSPVKIRADGQIWLVANCAVFFVAEGHQEKRDEACWAMAEGFLSLLPNNTFSMNLVGAPSDANIDPLISAQTSRKGVTIIAVSWKQEIKHLGVSLFDDEQVLLKELYLNDDEEPNYILEEGE